MIEMVVAMLSTKIFGSSVRGGEFRVVAAPWEPGC
jgi:hypothetical protein